MCLTGARYDLAQARDLGLQIANSRMQEGLEQGGIEGAQFLSQPVLARKGLLTVEAIESTEIKFEMKAYIDDQQRMFEQEASELIGGDHAFADANQKGF